MYRGISGFMHAVWLTSIRDCVSQRQRLQACVCSLYFDVDFQDKHPNYSLKEQFRQMYLL